MNITSINQIADEMRSDKRKAENEIGNLRGLFAILSTRWHWEINRILREKKGDLWYDGHVESDLHLYYVRFKEVMEKFPGKTQEETMLLFAAVWPGYSPKYRKMFYELAQYETQKQGTKKFEEILEFIHQFEDQGIQAVKKAILHDMVHMLEGSFHEVHKAWHKIEKDDFKRLWVSMYGKTVFNEAISELIFDLYSDYYVHFPGETFRPFLRKIYEEFCMKNSIIIIWKQ
jgi:hypothetical protein